MRGGRLFLVSLTLLLKRYEGTHWVVRTQGALHHLSISSIAVGRPPLVPVSAKGTFQDTYWTPAAPEHTEPCADWVFLQLVP